MSKNQKINKIFIIACMLLTIVLLWQVKSFTDVPQMISYQGRLTDNNGAPLADGIYTMRFDLCKDAGCIQTPAWYEEQTDIQLSNGLFSTRLGRVTPLDSVNFDEQYYLRVKVGTDLPFDAQELSSSAYAMNVRDGIITSSKIADNAITSTKILDGAIVNDDISNTAKILQSKIDNTTRAIDADMVDGLHADAFATVVHSHPATDATTLDGLDSTYFATATHNHDADYVNVTGDNMTGGLNVAGNVGVGTTNPGAKLDVNGAIKAGGNYVVVDSNGQKAGICRGMRRSGNSAANQYFYSSTDIFTVFGCPAFAEAPAIFIQHFGTAVIDYQCTVASVSTTDFQLYCHNQGGAASYGNEAGYYWMAIGPIP